MTIRTFTFLIAFASAAMAEPVKLGLVSAEPPKEWVSEKPQNRLRSHQFKIKSGKEGVADAEIAIYPESKSDPEKVFPGWKATFIAPDDKTVDDISKVSKFEAGGATVHLLDISGTWKYRERPNDPKSKEEKRENYRVVWAIVVTKDEATHVRFSGPKDVVEANYAAFEKWLKAIR